MMYFLPITLIFSDEPGLYGITVVMLEVKLERFEYYLVNYVLLNINVSQSLI